MPNGRLPDALAGVFRRALIEAESAPLFLPTGRSRWTYLDHVEATGADGGRRALARLMLEYTQFGGAAYHETDAFEVFQYDRPAARFGTAVYTRDVARARITFGSVARYAKMFVTRNAPNPKARARRSHRSTVGSF